MQRNTKLILVQKQVEYFPDKTSINLAYLLRKSLKCSEEKKKPKQKLSQEIIWRWKENRQCFLMVFDTAHKGTTSQHVEKGLINLGEN